MSFSDDARNMGHQLLSEHGLDHYKEDFTGDFFYTELAEDIINCFDDLADWQEDECYEIATELLDELEEINGANLCQLETIFT